MKAKPSCFFGGAGDRRHFWNGGWGQGVIFESFLTSDFLWSFYTSLHVAFLCERMDKLEPCLQFGS